MTVTLVLNADRFLEDMVPGALQELADGQVESGLYSAIRSRGHRILVTYRASQPSIQKEYQTKAISEGLGTQFADAMDYLRTQGNILSPNLPRTPIPTVESRLLSRVVRRYSC